MRRGPLLTSIGCTALALHRPTPQIAPDERNPNLCVTAEPRADRRVGPGLAGLPAGPRYPGHGDARRRPGAFRSLADPAGPAALRPVRGGPRGRLLAGCRG